MKKYRIVKHYIDDIHFITPPDEVIYESEDLKVCQKKITELKEGYKGAWIKFYLQEAQIKVFWENIE